MLYVLQSDKTPFYVHAMILNSYIESSWKCIDGGSVLERSWQRISGTGRVIHRNTEVKKIIVEDGKVSSVELADGSHVFAKNFIQTCTR